MKKLIGLVVVIAVLILGAYYSMGVVTERTLKKNVALINQSNGVFVDLEHYDRGWFESSAVLNWQIHIPERLVKNQNGQSTTIPAKDYKVQTPLNIYHGPIIFAGKDLQFGLGAAFSTIDIPAIYADKFSSMFTNESDKPKLMLCLLVNYLNRSHFFVGLLPFKLIAKQNGGQLDWYGMDAYVNLSSNLTEINGRFVMNGLSFEKDKSKAILGKVTCNFQLHQADGGVYIGEVSFSLPSLLASENGKNVFEILQYDVQANSDIDSGLFNSYFKLSFDKLVAAGKSYGPAIFEMALKNIDAQVLGEINRKVNEMQQGSNTQRQQALFSLLPELPKLFSKGPQLEISKLSIVVPEGLVTGDLSLSLPKDAGANPFQLMQKLQGKGQLKVPVAMVKGLALFSVRQKLMRGPTQEEALAQQLQNTDPTHVVLEQTKPSTTAEIEQQAMSQVEQKLFNLVQSGMLVLQGKDYLIDVTLVQGQLSVNGKPFDASVFQF